jgi:hypothetical protein
MASNIQRLEKDLDALILKGEILENAIQNEALSSEFESEVKKNMGKEEADKFLKSLPNFSRSYDSWYSEALVLIKQLLPDRLNNFISFYEKPKNRKEISYENYSIQDYLQGLVSRNPSGSIRVDTDAAVPKFRQQVSILKAAKRRFKSTLFEIRQLVQADLFDSEIDAARELLKKKFYRAAGAVAGVVLEKHLQQVCEDHNITVKKNPGINVLNEALKSNSIVDVPQWRHITMLGDIRNICDHSKDKDPTQQQIEDLLEGTDKILKTVA